MVQLNLIWASDVTVKHCSSNIVLTLLTTCVRVVESIYRMWSRCVPVTSWSDSARILNYRHAFVRVENRFLVDWNCVGCRWSVRCQSSGSLSGVLCQHSQILIMFIRVDCGESTSTAMRGSDSPSTLSSSLWFPNMLNSLSFNFCKSLSRHNKDPKQLRCEKFFH